MDKNVKIFIAVVVILILGVIGTVLVRGGGTGTSGPGQYDALAQCLTDKGAKFYGAFWCPHCQAQKKMFGSSSKYLPYIECSTADGNAQTKECIDAGVKSYPTWEFADGSRLSGEIPLQTLAEKTGCVVSPEQGVISGEVEVQSE